MTNSSNFASLTVDTSTLVVNGTTNRVGIGTATPFTRAVVGGGSGTEVLTIFSGSSGEGQIRFADATSGTGSYQGRVEYDHVNGLLNLGAGGATPFTITSDGDVGIGTSSPTGDITKFGGSAHGLSVYAGQPAVAVRASSNAQYVGYLGQAGDNTYLGAVGGGSLYIQTGTSGTTQVTVLQDGNVGIGTTAPDQPLQVKGVIETQATNSTCLLYTSDAADE